MNRIIIISICCLALLRSAFAQAPTASPIAATPAAPQVPKPGPEIQKLAYYLGAWKGEGEAKSGPFGSAGKLSSSTTCEWFTGGFHLVCRGEETGPTGKREFLNIRGYDEQAKRYTEYSISSFGESEYNVGGSIVGNKRTFVWDGDAGGKPAKFRYTEIQVSPTFSTYQAEASISGGPWIVLGEGKVTKVK